jgi:hypothetical protein
MFASRFFSPWYHAKRFFAGLGGLVATPAQPAPAERTLVVSAPSRVQVATVPARTFIAEPHMPDHQVVIPTRTMDPSAKLDWSWDWTRWLEAGETLAESVWTIAESTQGTPSLELLDTPTPSIVGAVTTTWIESPTAGERYRVNNHVVSSQGRADDRSFWIVGKEH